MTLLASMLLAALAATNAAPKSEIRSARIISPKITVSRERADSEVFVCGQVRVDMNFARKSVRNPVLRLSCLCDVDGILTVHTTFLDRFRTNDGMSRSTIQTAFRNAGVVISFKDREEMMTDPAKFTPYLTEVGKSSLGTYVYGEPSLRRGFFRLGRCWSMPKVLLYRIELWQNGALVTKYESSRAGLGDYGIPEDWYVWKKHPQKYRYADIR